jgi:hypothetical protein
MLSPQLLKVLRDWYRIARLAIPRLEPDNALTTRQLTDTTQSDAAARLDAAFGLVITGGAK